MVDELRDRLSAGGCQSRIVPLKRLAELKTEIEHQHRQGTVNSDFYREWLRGFDALPPKGLPEAGSIILAAVAQPQRQVVFAWEGKELSVVIPPTYFEEKTEKAVLALAREILEPAGYRVIRAALPKKLLAVRSGLAEYGRNNITYIPGMGSFFGLVAFYSDLPAGSEQWRETRMMERCNNCFACRRRCPTGAITAERFLLRAERCLTFHNEHPAAVPFPDWIETSWHNCLIGCLTCQSVCPANIEHPARFADPVRFSPEETIWLLQEASAERLPPGLKRKLRRAGLTELLEVLPRNLRVMMEQPEKAR
jgi:epoxyqueuosine reductase